MAPGISAGELFVLRGAVISLWSTESTLVRKH